MKKRYWLRGAITGLLLNVTVFVVCGFNETQNVKPCSNIVGKECPQGLVTDFMFKAGNLIAHQFPYNDTVQTVGTLLVLILLSVVPGIIVGIFTAAVYGKIKNRKITA